LDQVCGKGFSGFNVFFTRCSTLLRISIGPSQYQLLSSSPLEF
jgi:hypothetical protein